MQLTPTGPRIEYHTRLFLSGEFRGGYTSMPYVLIKNAAPEIGDHNVLFGEYYVAVGINFKLSSPKEKTK